MNASVKKYGTIAAVTLVTLLVVNSLAKRVPAVAKAKNTIDTGI